MITPTLEVLPHYCRHDITHALFDFDGTLSLIRDGWTEIMLDQFFYEISKACGTVGCGQHGEHVTCVWPLDKNTRFQPIDDIVELTGHQTIIQMQRLAERVKQFGGTPQDPEEYKSEFLRRLEAHIAGRVSGLGNGTLSPDGFLVRGSARLLSELRREVVACYVFSGTDEKFVIRDLSLLNIDSAFDFVFGARSDLLASSKKETIQRVLIGNQITGDNLVVFGDGMVEIREAKAVGALAVGVASKEGVNGERDEAKRNRLVEAGADLIVADYQKFDLWMPLILGV